MTSIIKLTVPDCSDPELMRAFQTASQQECYLSSSELADWVGHQPGRLDHLASMVSFSRSAIRACISDTSRFIPKRIQREMRVAMRRIEAREKNMRKIFEAELTGELASIGIEERAAQAHIAQFWTGSGYSTHELQSRWEAYLSACRTCALPDDCRGCPHYGNDHCCGGAV